MKTYSILTVIVALVCAASDQTATLLIGLVIIAPVPVMMAWRIYNNEINQQRKQP